ncbi:hypothetical protein D3C72_2268810 [compost metagenome]
MPVSRLCTGSRVTSVSPMRIRPAVGAMKPAIMRSVVVLPQPLGPRKVTSSPSAISSEKSDTATAAPNCLRIFSIETFAISYTT